MTNDSKTTRGRPALHPPGTTPSQRAKLARAAVLAEGGSKLDTLLDAPTTAALQAIQHATGETKTAIVSRLIQAESRRIKRKGGTS